MPQPVSRAMGEVLVIENGPAIQLQDQPAQGTRHEVLFGVMIATADPVVVKLERIPGALARERAALTWLGTRPGPAPRLLAAGQTVIRYEHVACLVTERCRGSSPTTIEGWRRMGRAHGLLAALDRPPGGLTVLDGSAFGRQHVQRLADLGDRLAPLAASIPDWAHLVLPEPTARSPLVITHGDPGPGNFLDDGHDGTLVDWEEAHVAPRGLDVARLAFIALLGAGPSGYVARDHQSRARAAVDGYLGALRNRWRPSRAERRWWTTVAGIQFVHRRWQLHGQPAPWEDAAEILRAALTDDLAWADC